MDSDAASAFGGVSQFEFVSAFGDDNGASWEVSSQPDEDREEGYTGAFHSDTSLHLLPTSRPVVLDDGESVVSGLTGAQFRYIRWG